MSLKRVFSFPKRSSQALPTKPVELERSYANFNKIYSTFIASQTKADRETQIIDVTHGCAYLENITRTTKLDPRRLGINALIEFVKTSYEKNELVSKKGKKGRLTREFINEAIISAMMTREYYASVMPSYSLGRMFVAFHCKGTSYMFLERYDGIMHEFEQIMNRKMTLTDAIFICFQV